MIHLLKFINKTYWKTIVLPVMSFIFPIFYVAIIGGVWSLFSQLTPSIILPAAWSIGIITTTLLCIPQMIFDLQSSVLIKRLGVSKYKPWMFYLLLIAFFIVINFFSYLFLIATSYLVLMNNALFVTDLLVNANYWEVLYSLFISFIMGLSIGLFLVNVCKTTVQIQIIGSIILIISVGVSGMLVPIAFLYNINYLYRIITLISPFTYTNSLLTESWFHYHVFFNVLHSSIFSPGTPYVSGVLNSVGTSTILFVTWQKWLNLLVPVILTIGFMGFNLSMFTYKVR